MKEFARLDGGELNSSSRADRCAEQTHSDEIKGSEMPSKLEPLLKRSVRCGDLREEQGAKPRGLLRSRSRAIL